MRTANRVATKNRKIHKDATTPFSLDLKNLTERVLFKIIEDINDEGRVDNYTIL